MWRLLAPFLLLTFWCQPAAAATFYQINSGATIAITEHSACAVVTNSHASGLALFVPTGTPAEWTAFRASPGAGVTAVTCDTAPTAFDFTPNVTNAALNTLTTAANTVTISGINTSAPVSVSGGGSPQIRINGGAWVTSGTIANGQTLQLRLTSSGSGSTALTATVNVGGVTDTWSVTTAAGGGGSCSTNANCSSGGKCVGGQCWYLGINAQSCDTVCASRSGTNIAVTRDYAGSGGTTTNCRLVSVAFFGSVSFFNNSDAYLGVRACEAGFGCTNYALDSLYGTIENSITRCTSPTTTSNAALSFDGPDYFGGYSRFCACNN